MLGILIAMAMMTAPGGYPSTQGSARKVQRETATTVQERRQAARTDISQQGCRPPAGDGISPAGSWKGACRSGLAHGVGTMGAEAEGNFGTFAGRAEDGLIVSGVMVLEGGSYRMVAPEAKNAPKGIDPIGLGVDRAFDDAEAGASEAARLFDIEGNPRSASRERRMLAGLRKGRPR